MLIEKKHIALLSALCFTVYFTSYITRVNLGAIVSEIVSAEGLLKSSVSFIITAGFFAYGIGQLISGFIADRINPKKIIFVGLICTAVLNFVLPFSKSLILMTIIWTLNGLAQSTMWPTLLKVMSTYFSKSDFSKSCATVLIGSLLGTISIYLFAPVVIHFFNWKMVLVIAGTFAFIIAFVWIACMNRIEHYSNNSSPKQKTVQSAAGGESNSNANLKALIASSGIIFIIIGILSQGIIRDGVTTWMPSYISETFDIKSTLSIFSAVVIPIFGIIAIKTTAYLNKRLIKNEMTCAAVVFSVAFLAVLLMAVFHSSNPWLSIALSSIITGCMHGVNLIILSYIPVQFNRYGNVSSISGILNFFAHIGGALSMYSIAKIAELFGWQMTILTWALIIFIGTASCLICIKKWARFTKDN
ncbi:MAG: MFS transporter [Clostridiales bacterium]|nr:MFS transporter [Clostridiales bacterium]